MWRMQLNPITRKRLKRFKELKRAYWSFWILVALYAVSLAAELLCNSVPLYVHCNGTSYFPVFHFYPDDAFTGSGKFSRPDYKAVRASEAFRKTPGNWMLFPPVPYGPYEVVEPAELRIANEVTVRFTAATPVGSLTLTSDLTIAQSVAAGWFLGVAESDLRNRKLSELCSVPAALPAAVAERLDNRAAARATFAGRTADGSQIEFSLIEFQPRVTAPNTVKITLRRPGGAAAERGALAVLDSELRVVRSEGDVWGALPDADQAALRDRARQRFDAPVQGLTVTVGAAAYDVGFEKEDVRFPFRPAKGHWMGIDSAGRDVLARVLYGLRTSMTFGLVLVVFSLVIGTLCGAVQGYLGGWVDITGQRLIEVWSALPFLYVMILIGSVYGRNLILLIVCYGLFNWIGISYYMRGEFLRLRKQPFVEAAKCLGLPARTIVLRHILPNALVPLITFFPFSLVGAIGSLAALDYLGFGLPPPTPSWGELLQEAQQFRWAWWLILYPSLSLFVVMLLGVFVGEGVRNAFDPRRFSRLE